MVKTDHVSKSSASWHKQVDFLSFDNYLSVYRGKSWEIDNMIRTDSDEGVRSNEMYNSCTIVYFPNCYIEKHRLESAA